MELKLDTGLYTCLQEHIDRCFLLMRHMGGTIEWTEPSIHHEIDGITLMQGSYKILDNNGNVVISNPKFKCATVTYILGLKNITPEFCYRVCISQAITRGFGM